MPHVNHEIKLDFKDVLLRPKRSYIQSRADVNVKRRFTFLHSKRVCEGTPIIASNMDTVGTFEMAAALAKVMKESSSCTYILRAHNELRSSTIATRACTSTTTSTPGRSSPPSTPTPSPTRR